MTYEDKASYDSTPPCIVGLDSKLYVHISTQMYKHTLIKPVQPVSAQTGFLSSVSTRNPTGISMISGGNLKHKRRAGGKQKR